MYEGTAPTASRCSSSASPTTANRAASEVRVAMTRNGGSMADPGSVSYLFNRKGVVIVPKAANVTEDDVLLAVPDAGAEVNDLGEASRSCRPRPTSSRCAPALQDAGIDYESAESSFLPSMQVEVDEDTARKGVPPHRRPRGQRRRPDRLRQRRRQDEVWLPSTRKPLFWDPEGPPEPRSLSQGVSRGAQPGLQRGLGARPQSHPRGRARAAPRLAASTGRPRSRALRAVARTARKGRPHVRVAGTRPLRRPEHPSDHRRGSTSAAPAR